MIALVTPPPRWRRACNRPQSSLGLTAEGGLEA